MPSSNDRIGGLVVAIIAAGLLMALLTRSVFCLVPVLLAAVVSVMAARSINR